MNNFKISSVDEVVAITLTNVPNLPQSPAQIFAELGAAEVNIDMICQTAPYKDKINLSFTIDQSDLTATMTVVGKLKDVYGELITEVGTGCCKFILSGEVLKTQCGAAARMFKALADNDLQIKLITTAETEISILLDNRHYDTALEVLTKEFI